MDIEKVDLPDEEQAKKQTPKEAAMAEVKEDGKKATFQFKYKDYMAILPFLDDEAPRTASGRQQNATVTARNYRLELDLTDPKQKRMHDALLKDGQFGVSFWLLSNSKKKQKTSEQGETLRKLMQMSDAQLRSMLTPDEMLQAGLMPSADRFDIAMAIIASANKKLVGEIKGETK